METKALDAKLRARGSQKLSDELDRLFDPLRERIRGAGGDLPLPNEKTPPETILDALDQARTALEGKLVPTYEQQEVDAFISDVDGMRAKIDEIDPRK